MSNWCPEIRNPLESNKFAISEKRESIGSLLICIIYIIICTALLFLIFLVHPLILRLTIGYIQVLLQYLHHPLCDVLGYKHIYQLKIILILTYWDKVIWNMNLYYLLHSIVLRMNRVAVVTQTIGATCITKPVIPSIACDLNSNICWSCALEIENIVMTILLTKNYHFSIIDYFWGCKISSFLCNLRLVYQQKVYTKSVKYTFSYITIYRIKWLDTAAIGRKILTPLIWKSFFISVVVPGRLSFMLDLDFFRFSV